MTKPSQVVSIASLLVGAWFGLGAVTGGLQLGMIVFFLPPGFLDEALRDASFAARVPPTFQFLLSHFLAVASLALVLFLTTSICAFGVWRRKEWARQGLLLMLALQIALACAGPAVALQIIQMNGPTDLPGAIGRIPYAFAVIAMLPSLCFGAAYGWFFYTLTRPQIRAEFT